MSPEEIKKNKEEMEKSKKAGGIVAPYEEVDFSKAGNPLPKKEKLKMITPKKKVTMVKKKK
jgi:predicted component of type VI protein secretion system